MVIGLCFASNRRSKTIITSFAKDASIRDYQMCIEWESVLVSPIKEGYHLASNRHFEMIRTYRDAASSDYSKYVLVPCLQRTSGDGVMDNFHSALLALWTLQESEFK